MATYYIENQLFAAIVNDDYSATTDKEDRQIEEFLHRIGGGFLVPCTDFTEWRLCDITGLWGGCYLCTTEK